VADKPLQQRSVEWRRKRCGVVTASRYADIMTEPRTKAAKENNEWSETARSYMLEKLGELITGVPADRFRSQATSWGMDWEKEAFDAALVAVAERFKAEVEAPVGEFAFIQHATEDFIGCSPDGIIGADGLLELKCPYNPANHLRTVLSGQMPDKHVEQVQGSLWVTGRQWYVFGSFDPRMADAGIDPLFVVRIERDEPYIKHELAPKVLRFRDWLLAEYQQLTGSKAPF
jgi:hypothetical protein